MRNITGLLADLYGGVINYSFGAFNAILSAEAATHGSVVDPGTFNVAFDASRVVPVGAKTAPRAYGVLPCVYLGRSAS